jgi:aminoglycoside phosphotransferase family enzyme
VYKIKKPLRFSFLDFSTKEARKILCFKEAALNRRLTHGIYIDVIPVQVENGRFQLGDDYGKTIDYALKMKRLDNNRQMNLLLEVGKVTRSHINAIVNQLVSFHYHADIVYGTSIIPNKVDDFEDILQIEEFLKRHFGVKAKYFLEQSVKNASDIIRNLSSRFLERDQN